MSEAHVEVVRGLFEAFNRRDLEGQLELLSEDYEWHPAFTGGGLVEGSVYHGREGFKRYWREQAETWAEIKLEVEELRDLGHRVLALAHIHALGRVSGLEVDQRFGGIWTFRGAELVEGRAYRTGDVAHAPHRRPRDLTLRVAALTLRARALASRRGGSVAPVRLELDDFTVTIAGRVRSSSTTIAAAGAYVIVVATTLPDQPAELTSCYLAGLRGPAAASHMLDVRGPHYRFHQQLLPDLLAGTTHPRRCLLHHAGELQAALVDLKDAQVLVDVGPRGLERADRVWDADINTS